MANFYKCDDCGGIVLEMTPPPKPCPNGQKEFLAPNTTDAAVEKHVPVVAFERGKLVVRIGSAPHPMLAEHYIEWVYVKTSFGGIHCSLNPGDPPEVEFKLQPGEAEEVYIYCNLHGLWKAKEPLLPPDFDVNAVACSPEFTAGCVNPSKG